MVFLGDGTESICGANEGFCELLCWMMGNYEGTRCGAAYEPLLLCPFVGCDLRA